jgi:hypothetical protein
MYKVSLINIEMLVVYGIFAFQNPFNNAKVTVVRGCIAVAVGWIMVILTSLLISKVELSVKSASIELSQLEEKDTAKTLGQYFLVGCTRLYILS